MCLITILNKQSYSTILFFKYFLILRNSKISNTTSIKKKCGEGGHKANIERERERERERDWAKDNDEESIGCSVDCEHGRFSFWERSVWCFWLHGRMYHRLRSIKHKTYEPLWYQVWDKMRSRFWSRRSHRLKNLGVSKMNATWNLFME